MARLIGGFGLLLGGIVLGAETGGLWYGAIAVGLLMVVSGSMALSRSAVTKAHMDQIVEKREDLLQRLLEKEPIDRIAEEYESSDGIPPIRTIQVAGYLIREMGDEDDEVSRALAAHMASDQVVDSNVDPEEAIDRFSFRDDVHFVDDPALLCRNVSNFGHTPGTLVLNKGYLFFFERSRWSGLGAKIAHGLGGRVPLAGVAAVGHELVSGLSRELEDYFDGPQKTRLKARFRRPKSRAFPLVDVVTVALTYKKHMIGATPLVEVRGNSDGEPWRCLFTSAEFQKGTWGSLWMDRLQIACIAEGNLLSKCVEELTVE